MSDNKPALWSIPLAMLKSLKPPMLVITSDPRPIVGEGTANGDPSWAPDNTKVAFRSSGAASNFNVFVRAANGSGGFAKLTTFASNSAAAPKFSPDGRKIAFIATTSGNPNVWLMDANGSAQQQLFQSTEVESDLQWSPDSRTILFVRDSGGNTDIWAIKTDGTNILSVDPLTTTPQSDEHPRWSPDGLSIVFETGRDGNREIYRMNADGTEQVNLSNDPGNDRAPDWGRCPTP